MAIAYANINPSILNWARERSQLSLTALANKLKITEDKLEAWESGDTPPTFKQAQSFAAKTHIPFGYLFLQTAPREELPLPDLRTIAGEQPHRPSAELIDIIQIIVQRQQWYLEYLNDQDDSENRLIEVFNIQTPTNTVVESMRQILGVTAHPERGTWEEYFRTLIRKIEEYGILVMRQGNLGHHTRPLSVAEFRGFAIYDPVAPVIFINQADAPSARLFTLIHELAHIWLGQSGISDAKPTTQRQEEIKCNAIAAEFLVPENEFELNWQELDNWVENIATLESHFHVSKWVIARRAQSLNKITLQQYQQYIDDLKEQHRRRVRTTAGPTYYTTKKSQLSERFSQALVSETLSGRVLFKEAGQLLDIKPHNITKYAKELGI